MATLKQVQDSQSPVANPTLNEMVGNGSNFSSVIPTSEQQEQGYVIFRLVKKKQRRLSVDGICDNVFNPKTNNYERIWLIRGTSTIWQSELGEDLLNSIDKPNSRLNKNRESLRFEDGICRVPKNDKRKLEYARRNIHNVGKNRTGAGKYDYYEYDAQEEQKFRLEKQTNRINMVIKAKEMPEEKMKKVAAFMGISFVDELGMPKGMDGVRSELMLKADTQPDLFERYIDSREVEVSWLVRRAILDAKIDLTAQSGTALWAGGKGFIGKIPSNRKAYEYLTELALTNSDEGRTFKEQLEQIVT